MPPGLDGYIKSVACSDIYLPDPENDANDDYAVLEWMRQLESNEKYHLKMMTNAIWDYKIGDNYRVALKVICEHSKTASGRLHAICKKCGEHIPAYSR